MSAPSPVTTGLAGRCPRCGEGRLFDGFLKLRPACSACGLDFNFADSGDGPAVLIMFLAGFLLIGGVLTTELIYEPPIWVHLALWIPASVILCLGLLRPLKGLTIAIQYANKAGQGRSGP
jgi:uncharacterized protein (DUF983 family)